MNSERFFTCTLTKHHALGNDFLVLDQGQFTSRINAEMSLKRLSDWDWPTLTRNWCDRRTGIGADGLLLLEIVDSGHLRMVLYNADGGPAEMSGNGIRCLAQAAHRRLSRELPVDEMPLRFIVDTAAGRRIVEVIRSSGAGLSEDRLTENELVMFFSVDMGLVEDVAPPENWEDLGCHEDRPVRHVSLGNPHSVVGVDDVNAVDLEALGAKVPSVNLEIVEPGPEVNAVTMRVHERGAGLTMACGTGACAVAEAAMTWGLVPASAPEIIVHMPGGDATVKVDRVSRQATLIGPTTFVAEISIDLRAPW